uniref:chromophore lyase cpcS/cpeS n=1 Tax=Glaucosphaera vacuolata TaxID=38265 RepID=UPI001FCDC0FA|nr:chromophore lyase cpcS/cpeS [Glaucosphaera vacuolata]UNJ18623.1 chromophore lyase cpcS/cpeS [Glaucosphaera vacuolata]
MMNTLKDFLKNSQGKWFVQQNIYNLWEEKVSNSKYNIEYNLDSRESIIKQNILSGILEYQLLKFSWNDTSNYFIILNSISTHTSQGLLIRFNLLQPLKYLQGTFSMDKNNSLIIFLTDGDKRIYEKVWFESSNFKLNFTILKQFGYSLATSFNSELRIIK